MPGGHQLLKNIDHLHTELHPKVGHSALTHWTTVHWCKQAEKSTVLL